MSLLRHILLEKKAELEMKPADLSGNLTVTDVINMAAPEISRTLPIAGAIIGPSWVATREARRGKEWQSVGAMATPTVAGYSLAHLASKGLRKILKMPKNSGPHVSELLMKTVLPLVGLKAGKTFASHRGYLKPADTEVHHQDVLSHKMDRIIKNLESQNKIQPISNPPIK